ncbi:MAG: hypothetical protein JW892_12660 [Anaerolineae bacterium]|nr:hypothetical protein [Anaerolineae bacterium]
MTAPLFELAVTAYQNASTARITRHRVNHPIFGQFAMALLAFEELLGPMSIDDYWRPFVGTLRRVRFDLCAAPLCSADRVERICETSLKLRDHLQFAHQLYPDLEASAEAILDAFDKLLDQANDPLVDKLLELTEPQQNAAWVIKESRLIPGVENLTLCLKLPNLAVLYPLQLRRLAIYDRVMVVGPSRWFPESIFTAPRSKNVDVVVFDWIKDDWTPSRVFAKPHRSSGPSSRNFIFVDEKATFNRWSELDAMGLLQVINNRSSASASPSGETIDKLDVAEAVCVLLENDIVVFFESGEGAQTLIIDPDEDPEHRIYRVPTKDLAPGLFILVKTSGTGDYIVPIADRIMGHKATKAREYQKRWKALLKDQVKCHGIVETSISLLDHGSNIANEVNVRNWFSPRSIRPHKYEDFLAIMRMTGLEAYAQEYWQMMGIINTAHHKAGFEIKKLLLEQIRVMDMDELQKKGRADFKLSDNDEGGITAFRVEAVLEETLEISYSLIGHPVHIEDHPWRA